MGNMSSRAASSKLMDWVNRQSQPSPLIAVVAGSGQIVRYATAGGADVLMVLNAGLYRTLGTGSLASFLPFGNANEQTLKLLREDVLPRSGETPVIAGVFACDPALELDSYLHTLRELGVAGVTNWPSLGFMDGTFSQALHDEGISVDVEMSMLDRARAAGLDRKSTRLNSSHRL